MHVLMSAGTSWYASVLLVVNAGLGAGLLNFPAAYHQCGGIVIAVSMQAVSFCVIYADWSFWIHFLYCLWMYGNVRFVKTEIPFICYFMIICFRFCTVNKEINVLFMLSLLNVIETVLCDDNVFYVCRFWPCSYWYQWLFWCTVLKYTTAPPTKMLCLLVAAMQHTACVRSL